MREVHADPVRTEIKKPLYIGRTGDNDTMLVFFPIGDWLREYAGCEARLAYGRPTETDEREVTSVAIVGNDLVWTVGAVDVEKAGTGVATVYMMRGEQVEKSAEYSVIVKKARPIGPTPTDAVKEWFLQILEAKGKGPRINEGTGTWEVWDVDAQEWVDTEVHAEGTSPRIEVEDVEGGHQVTVYDAEHPDGQTFVVEDGDKGDDGVSPGVTIQNITGGHKVTITDAVHPAGQSFDVLDGDKGDDGVSPGVTIQSITGGHKVTITDAAHPAGQSFDVLDGEEGDPGDDGVSPGVTIQSITGGHRVTITDEAHPDGQSFDVMDGEDAEVPIDDTEPASDKVFSSQKVAAEVSSLNQAILNLDSDLAEEKRKRQAMWELEEGIVYRFDEQTETGMNVAPSGAFSMTMENVQGKSEQESTTGANILKYPYTDTTKTVNGITFTDNGDGSITVNGTSTGIADYYFNTNGRTTVINKGSCSLKWLHSYYDDYGINLQVDIYDSDGTYVSTVQKNNVTAYPDAYAYQMARIIILEDTTVNNVTVYPMLCLSTATTYEPYTGGLPSPSPDYPQEIHSVEEINVKVTGQNLFDVATYPFTDGVWINAANGTHITASGYMATMDFVPCKGFGQITLNHRPGGNYTGFAFYNAEKTYVSGQANLSAPAGQPWTLTVPSDAYYMRFTISASETDNIQIEYGSVAHNYKPYEQPVTRTITPSRPMNGVGTLVDTADVETGKYTFNYAEPLDPTKTVAEQALETPVVEDIPAEDLSFLRSLENIPADHHIFVTDQDGNDVSYLLEYIVSLRGVLNNA